jgi:hypothetical protein
MESTCRYIPKWFNANGGYSYLVLISFIQPAYKTIDEIVKYDNVQTLTALNNWKKLRNHSKKYKHALIVLYKEYITHTLTSPSVEMYVHQTPFNQPNR